MEAYTIILRYVIARIRSEPWSNQLTKQIWCKSMITFLQMRSQLLTMLWQWLCIFSLMWSPLLLLSSSFLLIFGQEFLKTRPSFLAFLEFFQKLPDENNANKPLNLYMKYPIILLFKVKVTPKYEFKLYNYTKILKSTNIKFWITIYIIINILLFI